MGSCILLNVLYVIIAIAISLYAYVKLVAFNYWKKRNVPSFEASFPLGNLEPPHNRTMSIGESFSKMYNNAKNNGWKYFGIYFFAKPLFVPIDLDIIKDIMTKDFYNFTDRGVYINEKDEPITAHLFAIGGIKWRNLRTKLSPTFTSGKMRMMFQTLADCGALLEKTLEKFSAKNEPIDIKNVLGCFSTDIIGSCAFGLECNTINQPNSPFRTFGLKIFKPTPWLNLKIAFAMTFQKLALKLGVTITTKEVSEFFSQVVKDTVEYRENNNISRNDFLQILLNIKNNKDPDAKNYVGDGTSLTMDEMIAQCFVFFIAGFETSSTTMTFVLFELARHPEIQDKVRDEIDAVLKKHQGKISYDALKEMVYMQQVIDEALRMYPPVAFVTRLAMDDYQINDHVVLEKNTRVFIPIRGIHYDEEYYPNPTEFNPDRFSEEQKQQRHQYAHIPFGEGPRICIGMRFGLMQTKVGLTTILKDYKVSLSSKMKLPIKLIPKDFIPNVEGGVWLNIDKI